MARLLHANTKLTSVENEPVPVVWGCYSGSWTLRYAQALGALLGAWRELYCSCYWHLCLLLEFSGYDTVGVMWRPSHTYLGVMNLNPGNNISFFGPKVNYLSEGILITHINFPISLSSNTTCLVSQRVFFFLFFFNANSKSIHKLFPVFCSVLFTQAQS